MSALTIEVYYSFQSPYSHLALDGLYALEADFDVNILWQLFSAKAAGHQMPPYPVVPEKLMYLFEDTKRHAERLRVPIKFPETWPESEFDPTRVTRGAVVATDLGILMEYNYKVFSKWWGEGEDPNDPDYMTELCDDLDIDPGDFLGKVSASDTKERVKGMHKRGRKLGVFDTPTIVIDGKLFVGIDKLTMVREILTEKGLAKKAA